MESRFAHEDDILFINGAGSALSIIDIDSAHELVEVSGDLSFKIGASVYSSDDEYTYRESDTREFVCLARLYESIEAVVEANVHGFPNVSEFLARIIHDLADQTPRTAGVAGLSLPDGSLRTLASSTTCKGRLRASVRKLPPGTDSRRFASRLMNNPG